METMTMTKRLWILGAADPEMAAIEQLLRDAGEDVAYACVDGVRVHPGNAYSLQVDAFNADGYLHRDIYSVECAAHYDIHGDSFSVDRANRIDHHRPGDPGYGQPPEEYWSASSLGQVVAALGCPHADDAHLIAAADHCLAAAYAGQCPGVDPDELMLWRVASRAEFQGRSEAEVLADVKAARERLRSASIEWRENDDCNGYEPGERRPYAYLRHEFIPELPEAAAREGIPYIADTVDRDGRNKVVLQAVPQGSDLVQRFMAGAIVPGLSDCYGDPARGFAGGYLT